MAKSLKRMICVVMAAMLALLPLSAWAAMTGDMEKINENEVKVIGEDLAGEHSVQVDLKIVDDAGKAIQGASFSFSSVARDNAVYQSPYNNDTGLMTIIVSNGEKELNGVGAGDYDIGTLNVPTQGRAFVTMDGITSSDVMFRLQSVKPAGGILHVELNPVTDPDPDDPGNSNTNTNTNVNTNTNTNTNNGNNQGGGGTNVKTDISTPGSSMASGLKKTYSYNGGNTIPIDFDFIVNGSNLTNGTDYIYKFTDMDGNPVSEVNAVGKYKLVVEGIGKYKGTYEQVFSVEDNYVPGTTNIMDATIEGLTLYYTYTGKAIKLSDYTVKYNGTVLREGTDYTVSYADMNEVPVASPTDVGTYYLVITGKGAYSGETSQTFQIVPQPQGGNNNNQNVTGDPNVKNKTPQTGDSMTTVIGICLAVAAVAALILAIVAFRRSKVKKTR